MPTVSVIMPMYNSAKYVKQAIESLLEQTYKDIEVIAINDGSKDGCADIVRSIHDDRLIFVDRENRGFLYTLNECIDMAKGKYIARLDDDDWSYPTRIEKQVKFLEEHPETVLVGSLCDYQTGDEIKKTDSGFELAQTPNQIRYALIFENYSFAHSTFMMRKSVLMENNIRYEIFKQVPDYHIATQLVKFGELSRIPESLSVYRFHAAQSTQVRSIKMKQDEIDHARAMYIDTLELDEEKRVAIKRGVLRKLKTYDDIRFFDNALKEFAIQCGMSNNADKLVVGKLYKKCMISQFCTPTLLMSVIKNGNIRWMLSTEGMKFIIKCLIKKNSYYLETEVKL